MNIEVKIEKLYSMMDKCEICPRKCGVNRNGRQTGICKTGNKILISSYNVHMGEEPPITGKNGSGTIFFTNCTLKCVFCQNYPISQMGNGKEVSVVELADIMIELQNEGVHNINFVTPTHYSPQISEAVCKARNKGLKVPIVFNCSGYERVEVIKLLEDIVDIYLPDIKYSDNKTALKYSGIKDYVEVNRAALKEMVRQKGLLKINNDAIAESGVLIRHMVLPGNVENTKKSLEFIANELSPQTFISLMSQYHPAYKSYDYKELSRIITADEYEEALVCIEKLNFENGWQQEQQ
ncbi:MAG: radical SAM protein [Endomicrobium sp.]|jgi:putative pyruvate formate lyase activating enzyme|nr:radical SAM protein [Endomicrobium sp.]